MLKLQKKISDTKGNSKVLNDSLGSLLLLLRIHNINFIVKQLTSDQYQITVNKSEISTTLKYLKNLEDFSNFECTDLTFFYSSLNASRLDSKTILYITKYMSLTIIFTDIEYQQISNSNQIKEAGSITSFFPGHSWSEREASEMFNVQFQGLGDSRKLLLDYTQNLGPYLSSTTTTAQYRMDTVYNIVTESLEIDPNNTSNIIL